MHDDLKQIWGTYSDVRETQINEGYSNVTPRVLFEVLIRVRKETTGTPEEIEERLRKNYKDVTDIEVQKDNSGGHDAHVAEFTYSDNVFIDGTDDKDEAMDRLTAAVGNTGKIVEVFDKYPDTKLFGLNPEKASLRAVRKQDDDAIRKVYSSDAAAERDYRGGTWSGD